MPDFTRIVNKGDRFDMAPAWAEYRDLSSAFNDDFIHPYMRWWEYPLCYAIATVFFVLYVIVSPIVALISARKKAPDEIAGG
jgi:hypothetical protein